MLGSWGRAAGRGSELAGGWPPPLLWFLSLSVGAWLGGSEAAAAEATARGGTAAVAEVAIEVVTKACLLTVLSLRLLVRLRLIVSMIQLLRHKPLQILLTMPSPRAPRAPRIEPCHSPNSPSLDQGWVHFQLHPAID